MGQKRAWPSNKVDKYVITLSHYHIVVIHFDFVQVSRPLRITCLPEQADELACLILCADD